LSKTHQQLAKEFMKHDVKVTLRGKSPGENLENYWKYIGNLFKTHDVLDKDDFNETTFRNYLQSPL
jgi:hypothetical protein